VACGLWTVDCGPCDSRPRTQDSRLKTCLRQRQAPASIMGRFGATRAYERRLRLRWSLVQSAFPRGGGAGLANPRQTPYSRLNETTAGSPAVTLAAAARETLARCLLAIDGVRRVHVVYRGVCHQLSRCAVLGPGSKGLKRQLHLFLPVTHGKGMTTKRSRIMERAQLSLREGRLEGIIDAPKSGRWGRWVYYLRRNKQCRRRYVRPRDPRTSAQLRCRAALSAASKAWSDSRKLTEGQRRACRQAGARVKTRGRLGQRGTLTGQLYFVARECGGRKKAECRMETDRLEAAESRLPMAEARSSEADIAQVAERLGCGRGWRSTWDEYRIATVGIRSHYRRRAHESTT
jgi:hypothetical protein